MDEARKIMRRLDRIEALKGSRAPAEELLGEVRQLLAEGEAWLAAETGGGGTPGGSRPAAGAEGTTDAASALADCRARLGEAGEVVPRPAGSRRL